MKTNKRAVCAAILLALATSFTACVVEPEEEPPLKITVTGLKVYNGKFAFVLLLDSPKGDTVASVPAPIANGSVGGNLRKDDGTDWTSTGDYYVMLSIFPDAKTTSTIEKRFISKTKTSIQSETTIKLSDLEEVSIN
jgi:hypothetical protein